MQELLWSKKEHSTLPNVSNAQDFVILYGIQNAIPNIGIWAIFAVIVLAAVMSTTDRLMLTIGAMFSWDIFKKVIRPNTTDKQVLLLSKIVVVLSAVITLLIALNPPDMLAFLIWMGIGIMLATFAVPLLAGLYWRRATRLGAIFSMASGLITSIIFGAYYNYVAKLPLHFSFYAFIISLVVMIVVSLITPKNDEKILNETETGWYIRFSSK